jgi:hypothetical protein
LCAQLFCSGIIVGAVAGGLALLALIWAAVTGKFNQFFGDAAAGGDRGAAYSVPPSPSPAPSPAPGSRPNSGAPVRLSPNPSSLLSPTAPAAPPPTARGLASPTKEGIDLETIQWAEGAQSGAGAGGSELLLGEAVKGLVPSPAGRREDPLHQAPSAASLDKSLEVEDSDDSEDLAAMYLSAVDKSMPLPPEPAVAVPVAISPGSMHSR